MAQRIPGKATAPEAVSRAAALGRKGEHEVAMERVSAC